MGRLLAVAVILFLSLTTCNLGITELWEVVFNAKTEIKSRIQLLYIEMIKLVPT